MGDAAEIAVDKKQTGTSWPVAIAVMVVVGGGIFAASKWDRIMIQLFGGSAYTCTNVINEVLAASATRVIGIGNPTQVSKTDDRLECKGIAVLSNGGRTNINYRAYLEFDKWWVSFEPS